MKYFILFSCILFLIYSAGFYKHKQNNISFMDRDFTTAIKGIAIISVIWAHASHTLGINGVQFLAGIGVSLFLICSGYGLEMSYKKNGLCDFWKKRFLNVAVPFWVVELIGLIIVNKFTLKKYLLDFFFIKSSTAYGWYMQYIVICYLLFFLVKKIFGKSSSKNQLAIMFILFGLWFVLDSVFFANPSMPSLRARQMFAFPMGMFIAQQRVKIEEKANGFLPIALFAVTGLLFTSITQIGFVRELPYILTNVLSLLTVVPLALAVLLVGLKFPILFRNHSVIWLGLISYELYLVHAFTLKLVKPSIISVVLFIGLTFILAYLLHLIIGLKNKALKVYFF
ncbi:MAG: acyltransferase family protein [Ruminococcus sp.]|nr:acyltransferase family protein [Ruminococcus sp.]